LAVTAGSLRKIDQHENFTCLVSCHYHDRGQRKENPEHTENQSDGKIRYHALLEKIKHNIQVNRKAYINERTYLTHEETEILLVNAFCFF